MANESELTDGSGYMTRSKRIPPQIQHDIENLCFFTDLGTSRAFLSYTQIGNIMQMEHTEVPSMYAGKGLGKLLAKFAFEYCVRNGYRMRLNCTFLQHYLSKYAPEYSCYVVTDDHVSEQ